MSDILDQIDALTAPQTYDQATAQVAAQVAQADSVTYLDPVVPSASDIYDASEYQGNVPVQRSGVESMFSVRHVPWHEIGNVIPEALRSSDIETILKAAGMDWTVSKRPVRALALDSTDQFTVATDDFFAMVRDDTNKVLGMVGKAYEPFQNADALDLLNDILASGETTVETAGVLFEGKKVWVLANIPRDLTVNGDVHVPYLCISTTHDGSGSIRADLTVMRTECQNSLRWTVRGDHLRKALEEKGITVASPSWYHRHSSNVKAKAADARRILGFAVDFLDAYEAQIEELMAKVVTDAQFDRLVKGLLPVGDEATDRQKSNVQEKRDKVRAFYESPQDGGKFKGTGWGVFQAFSSYDLWGANLREGEKARPTRQIVRLLDGTVEKRSTTVLDRIAALR